MARTLKTTVPPRNPRGRREGYTTGASAAAAAKAATRLLVTGQPMESIESTLPNGRVHRFLIERCERLNEGALCSIVKDGGDDPDCTHGAEIVAKVVLRREEGIEIRGGQGVARVTRAGLGLEIGGPAINPVPRRNIREMVEEELVGTSHRGALITISVPEGETIAHQTINARLGLLGGISILGTTGIVRPYSTAAFKMSVIRAIDVAIERGVETIVLTTGGKTETYAMKLYPTLPEEAFIQAGDFIGVAVQHCARRRAVEARVVAMIGKLSKMADGRMMTHAAGSLVNTELLGELSLQVGASEELAARIATANTARHVLEMAQEAKLDALGQAIAEAAVDHLYVHTQKLIRRTKVTEADQASDARRSSGASSMRVRALLLDFEGSVLAETIRPRALRR